MNEISRRRFMQLLGAGTASAAAGSWTPGCGDGATTASSRAASDRVIVIGAGAAGLVVGNALTAAGREVVVLEGRDRLGGRIWPREVGGVPVDLGGMWISGPRGNPATCILNDEGLGWMPAEPIAIDVKAYDAVLRREIPLTELAGVAIALEQFDAMLPELLASLGPRATFADAIHRFLETSGLGGVARRYAEFGLRTQTEISYAVQSERLALGDYDFSNPLPGGEHFPDGSYRGLIQALGRGVDVRLSTTVSRIEHSASEVRVETSAGTFTGSTVVVTVPLGVLKSGSIQFSPALPARKTAAIDRLAMAELEKVVLRYDDAFWQSPGSGNLLYVSETQGEFPHFVDYTPYAGGQPTLVGFYCGDYGRAIEPMSDDAIVGRVAGIVEEIAGTPGPAPTDAFVTRWKSDPFARGSYSSLPVGAGISDLRALGEPVGDRLLFAGEATSAQYSGYVHGALLTGVREAERLLRTTGAALLSGLVIEEGCDEAASGV